MKGDHLTRLLTWLSPSFPTGAFAYSHGLEWAVEAGDITSRAQLVDWLSDLVAHGSLWTDCILLRHGWRATDSAECEAVAAFGLACATSRERREETLAQGAAFRRALCVWHELPGMSASDWPLPVVLGQAFRAHGIDETIACLGALHAQVASLVSAAVRLVPLGQTDGLRTQAALEAVIADTVERSRGAGLEDVGGACLRADIASMRHETQQTRLFRT